jgi:hypothetical protein
VYYIHIYVCVYKEGIAMSKRKTVQAITKKADAAPIETPEPRKKRGRPAKIKPEPMEPTPEAETEPVEATPEPEEKPRKKGGRPAKAMPEAEPVPEVKTEPVETTPDSEPMPIEDYFAQLFGTFIKPVEPIAISEPEVEPVVELEKKPRRKGGRPAKAKPVEPIMSEPEPAELSAELEPEPMESPAEPEPEVRPKRKGGRPAKMKLVPVEPPSEPEAMPEPEPVVEPEPPIPPMKATERLQLSGRWMKPNPLFIETKSKRVQLLLQPSLFETMKELAAKNNKSFNEFVHLVFEDYIKEREPE